MKQRDESYSGSPLAHPLWLAALLVLLLNDHMLKGSGLLPGALTGKLSDFAGLIVAPVLLCVLSGARSRAARVMCTVLVGAAFAAIKLHAGAAQAFEQLGALFGLSYRVWVDPSDLLALPSLWVGFRLLERPLPAHRLAVHALALLGLFACVATTDVRELAGNGALLINHRNVPLQATVRWADPDCTLFQAADAGSLRTGDFGEASTLELLAEDWHDLALETDDSDDRSCGAVWLRIEGHFERLIAWQKLSSAWLRPPYRVKRSMMRRGVTVEGAADSPRVTVGERLLSFPRPPEGARTLPVGDDSIDAGAAPDTQDAAVSDAGPDDAGSADAALPDAGASDASSAASEPGARDAGSELGDAGPDGGIGAPP
jgi:hypothetical protein